MNWFRLSIIHPPRGSIPTTPSKNAPPGTCILAFLSRVRRDHALKLQEFEIKKNRRLYSENRFRTKISPRARKPAIRTPCLIEKYHPESNLPTWQLELSATKDREKPVPFPSMLLLRTRIAASSLSRAVSSDLQDVSVSYLRLRLEHLFLVLKKNNVWDAEARKNRYDLTIEMCR
jgi:hypothetical protein